MNDGSVPASNNEWVWIVVPKNGIYGDPPVRVRVPRVCLCGDTHTFDPPNPQVGDWYTYVDDPCEHTITYTNIWKIRRTRGNKEEGDPNVPMRDDGQSDETRGEDEEDRGGNP